MVYIFCGGGGLGKKKFDISVSGRILEISNVKTCQYRIPIKILNVFNYKCPFFPIKVLLHACMRMCTVLFKVLGFLM